MAKIFTQKEIDNILDDIENDEVTCKSEEVFLSITQLENVIDYFKNLEVSGKPFNLQVKIENTFIFEQKILTLQKIRDDLIKFCSNEEKE